MKNIHLLPTDKPSRLHFDGKLFSSTNPQISKNINSIVEGKNIYITSDKKIKEGFLGWFICQHGFEKKCLGTTIINDEIYLLDYLGNVDRGIWCKEIILTTDQDLIADGVQAINNEFLEWFVENSTCEFVEVKKRFSDFTVEPFIGYKIIIPKACTQDVVDEAMKIVSKDVRQPKCVRDGLVTEPNKHSRLDVLHLQWVYNRMIEVHNENPNYDYMIKFKQIITKHENFL